MNEITRASREKTYPIPLKLVLPEGIATGASKSVNPKAHYFLDLSGDIRNQMYTLVNPCVQEPMIIGCQCYSNMLHFFRRAGDSNGPSAEIVLSRGDPEIMPQYRLLVEAVADSGVSEPLPLVNHDLFLVCRQVYRKAASIVYTTLVITQVAKDCDPEALFIADGLSLLPQLESPFRLVRKIFVGLDTLCRTSCNDFHERLEREYFADA